MYIRIFTWVYMYTYIYRFIWVQTYIYVYIYMCTYIHIYMGIYGWGVEFVDMVYTQSASYRIAWPSGSGSPQAPRADCQRPRLHLRKTVPFNKCTENSSKREPQCEYIYIDEYIYTYIYIYMDLASYTYMWTKTM